MLSINRMDHEKKKKKKELTPRIKQKLFTLALVLSTPWNFEKCYKTKFFRCKLRVNSNFINVNLHILLFSFISNFEDGQNRVIQLLKPTRTSSSVNKYMLKVNNRNIDNRDVIDVFPVLDLNIFHSFCLSF